MIFNVDNSYSNDNTQVSLCYFFLKDFTRRKFANHSLSLGSRTSE